jgi:hypothetical protein
MIHHYKSYFHNYLMVYHSTFMKTVHQLHHTHVQLCNLIMAVKHSPIFPLLMDIKQD